MKTETASRNTALTDTVATWNLRTSVLTEARKAKLAALESARSPRWRCPECVAW